MSLEQITQLPGGDGGGVVARLRVPKTPSMICDLQILTNGQ
ncbi:hypothetical protein [Streptomyces sp. RLB3-6]|nr:hypothetical protein [Streptomyces sp. RLB3-6]